MGLRCVAIIPAGGSGSRFGGETPKQYLALRGKAILAHTIDRLLESGLVDRVVVATPSHDSRWAALSAEHRWSMVTRVDGGEHRQDSVRNAVEAAEPQSGEIVAVHDAVRPFFSHGLFRRLLEVADKTGAAVPGSPVRDTIHVVDGTGLIQATPDRQRLRAVQTPQCFRAEVLLGAYETVANLEGPATDEAALVRNSGAPVQVVDTDEPNPKITLPVDLEAAERHFEEWW